MGFLVFWKMGADGGQALEAVIARREFERRMGNGIFWWAIGSPLGQAVRCAAEDAGGVLPVLFSQMPSKPQRRDTHPNEILLWPEWQDLSGTTQKVPDHILLWSRGTDRGPKQRHYALVCHSDTPVMLGCHGPFDPTQCQTHLGQRPGTSQVTALLRDDARDSHVPSKYRLGFRASIICPWFVRLVNPRQLTPRERVDFSNWPQTSKGWETYKTDLR